MADPVADKLASLKMDREKLKEIHDVMLQVAEEAGRMIIAANPNKVEKDTKMNSVDIVTETDKAVEVMVSTTLREAYPDFLFIGEETYVAGETIVTDAPTFIVDPIDGTTNFVHSFPYACISLGLAVGKTPVIGVVYNPFLDIMYSGMKGRGAFVTTNSAKTEKKKFPQKLPLAGSTREGYPELKGLGSALVAIEWGSGRSGHNWDLKTKAFVKLGADSENGGKMVHGFRSMGSAALNLCAVAAGTVDCYWEGGCYAWDVCAGWAILNEAGGKMFGGNPGEWETSVDSRCYLAVRGAKEEEQKGLVEEFWSCVEGKMDYKH